MHNSLESTRQFMQNAGQQVKTAPGIPSQDILLLRLSLELEELYEKAQAMGLEGTFQKMMLDKVPAFFQETDMGDAEFVYEPAEDTGIFNMAEVLDACADQRVVADGTILACGLQDVFDGAMDDVSSSNLSKFCNNEYDVADTIKKYKAQGVDATISTPYFPDLYPAAILRASDRKVLKAINYRPANMQSVLDNFYQSL